MNERPAAVTMQGNPLTLVGQQRKVGDKAPDFTVVANDLTDLSLSDFAGQTLVISAVPSLDTPVCDRETRRFNKEAAALGPHVKILTVSMDLPFAQKRWCGAAEVDRVVTASDHRDASFGKAYGVLIKELRLLARCVFVVDSGGMIRHIDLCKEVTSEPNYDAVLEAVSQASRV